MPMMTTFHGLVWFEGSLHEVVMDWDLCVLGEDVSTKSGLQLSTAVHVAESGAWLEHPCLLQQPDSPTDLRLDYSDDNHKTVIVLSSFYF